MSHKQTLEEVDFKYLYKKLEELKNYTTNISDINELKETLFGYIETLGIFFNRFELGSSFLVNNRDKEIIDSYVEFDIPSQNGLNASLLDVLNGAIEAIEHQKLHDCDCHGHEVREVARLSAIAWRNQYLQNYMYPEERESSVEEWRKSWLDLYAKQLIDKMTSPIRVDLDLTAPVKSKSSERDNNEK